MLEDIVPRRMDTNNKKTPLNQRCRTQQAQILGLWSLSKTKAILPFQSRSSHQSMQIIFQYSIHLSIHSSNMHSIHLASRVFDKKLLNFERDWDIKVLVLNDGTNQCSSTL